MKHLAIITHEPGTALDYAGQLAPLFGEEICIRTWSLEEALPPEISADACLVATHSLFELIEPRIGGVRHAVIAGLTLKRACLEPVRRLPAGTKAMLVNLTMEMAIETINLIYNAGICNVELFPVYPGIRRLPELSIAVTPGETQLVPPDIATVINLSSRVLSVHTIAALAVRLSCAGCLSSSFAKRYFSTLLTGDLEEFLLLMNHIKEGEGGSGSGRRLPAVRGHIARYEFSHIVTRNPEMLRLKEMAEKMAASSSSVLISGPSGTGKELFAQSIHNASPRRGLPFLAVNCASIPGSLLESELFGYQEGAFTGARKGGKPGYFEQAHLGTLFLDEIGEMDLALQTRLLRVLQEKEVIRVGADRVISVDVRVIAATNKNLTALIRQGKFREDLYYRLNILSLSLPPLSRRREDIPLLINALSRAFSPEPFVLTEAAMEFLTARPWRGNVRELGNFVERAFCLGVNRITLEEARALTRGPEEETEEEKTERETEEGGLNRKESVEGRAAAEPREASDQALEEQLSYFMAREQADLQKLYALLSLLSRNQAQKRNQGRKGLSSSLAALGYGLGESEIRRLLRILCSYGLAESRVGRGGTTATELGKAALERLCSK